MGGWGCPGSGLGGEELKFEAWSAWATATLHRLLEHSGRGEGSVLMLEF